MIEMLKPSVAQRAVMEEFGLKNVELLIYADLRRCGWNEADAFYAAYRDSYARLPKGQQRTVIKRIENDKGVQRRITGNDGEKKDDKIKILPSDEIAKATSKEKILSDLLMARKGTAEGSKEWSDLTKMIADIAKVKQDEIKVDDEPIKYFLPAHYPTSCKDCLLALNNCKNGEYDAKGKK